MVSSNSAMNVWLIFPCLVLVVRARAQNGHENELVPFEGIRECPHGDEKLLNECLRLIVNETRAFLVTGVPELGVVVADPFVLPEYRQKISPNFHYVWRNMTIYGISKFSTADAVVNTKEKTLNLYYEHPFTTMSTDAELEGRIFGIVPVKLAGKLEFEFTNLIANDTYFLEVVRDSDGEPTLRIREVVSNNMLDAVKIRIPALDRLGQPGQALHTAMNAIAARTFRIFIPWLNRAQGEVLKMYAHLAKLLPASHFL